MTPQKIIKDWKNIELGKHGVRISKNNRSGTLLPQVAAENNYDLEAFLQVICEQKAGLDKYCYMEEDAKIYIFETEIFSEKDL